MFHGRPTADLEWGAGDRRPISAVAHAAVLSAKAVTRDRRVAPVQEALTLRRAITSIRPKLRDPERRSPLPGKMREAAAGHATALRVKKSIRLPRRIGRLPAAKTPNAFNVQLLNTTVKG